MALPKLKIALCAGWGFAMLSFAAQVGPSEAVSNLGQWLQLLGIENIPSWVLSARADAYVARVSFILAVIFFTVAFYHWQMAKNGTFAAVVRGIGINLRSRSKKAVVNSIPADAIPIEAEKIDTRLAVAPDSIKIKSKLGSDSDIIRCQFTNTTFRAITKCSYQITNLQEWSPEHTEYFVPSENFVPIAIKGSRNLEPGKDEEITVVSRQTTTIHIDGVRDDKYLPFSQSVRENSIWKLTLAVSSQDKFVRQAEIFFKCLANRRFELRANPAKTLKPPS